MKQHLKRYAIRPAVLLTLASSVLVVPLPFGMGPGSTTAHAQPLPSQMSGMQAACRWVWNRATGMMACVSAPSMLLGFGGPAGALAGAMSPRGSMPHEWYPYRDRDQAIRAASGFPPGMQGPLPPRPPRPPVMLGPEAPRHLWPPPRMSAQPPRIYPPTPIMQAAPPHVHRQPGPTYPTPTTMRHRGPFR